MRRLLLLGLLLPALARAQATRVIPSDSYTTGCALTSTSTACEIEIVGKSSVGFIVTGLTSNVGFTLVAEGSRDHTNWTSRRFVPDDGSVPVTSIANATLAVGYQTGIVIGDGDRWIHVKPSAVTSGTVTVAVTGTDASGTPVVLTVPTGNQAVLGTITPADSQTNPTAAVYSFSLGGLYNGSTWDRWHGSSAGGAWVQGPVAQAGAWAGNPVLLGAYAEADGAAMDAAGMAAGDVARLKSDYNGRLLVRTDHPNRFVCRVSGQTTMVNMTCSPALPGGASVFHYVDSVVLSNGPTAQTLKVLASTTTACGGSPTDVTSTVYLGVNGGAMLSFATPIKIGQANSYLCCQGSGNTAASCTVTGFLGP